MNKTINIERVQILLDKLKNVDVFTDLDEEIIKETVEMLEQIKLNLQIEERS